MPRKKSQCHLQPRRKETKFTRQPNDADYKGIRDIPKADSIEL